MFSTSSLAETAALVGDPARASMLMALMDGRALTASELARAAGIMPQTASGHLARLCAAGLLSGQRQGRHHYHRLASPTVARMLESIIEVSASGAPGERRRVVTGPRDQAMRAARTCYDHLAGRLGVALADALTERGHVELSPEGGAVTRSGTEFSGISGWISTPPRARPHASSAGRVSTGASGGCMSAAPSARRSHRAAWRSTGSGATRARARSA